MIRLILIRHGRSRRNAGRRVQGWSDSTLDSSGLDQARLLVERLRSDPPDSLYTSSLLRAKQTALIIGEALDLPVISDDRLRERDLGEASGLTWEQLEERHPDVARHWREGCEQLEIPGEEGSEQFEGRVVRAFDEIVSSRGEGTVGVVAHGGTFGAYLNHLIGLPSRFSPFRFANASLTIVEPNPVRPRIVLLNDTCHLGGLR